MNAIIIAAGSGKRISNELKETPKSMVKVNGIPIIEYQISVLNKVGISRIFVITGPFSEKFDIKNIEYIKDEQFEEHDILGSLMEAKDVIKNEVLILYSDIIFELKIIEQVLESNKDISIAVDMDWRKKYEDRTQHPVSEAENVQLNNMKKITEIKKNITYNENVGEFLGIMKLSTIGSKKFIDKYNEILKLHTGKFHNAPSLKKAYLTDMIQELIDSNVDIHPIIITGRWCEIDTIQDLKNAEKIFF